MEKVLSALAKEVGMQRYHFTAAATTGYFSSCDLHHSQDRYVPHLIITYNLHIKKGAGHMLLRLSAKSHNLSHNYDFDAL
jgi:hypothetical protein